MTLVFPHLSLIRYNLHMKINWHLIIPISTIIIVSVGTIIGVQFVQGNTINPTTGEVKETGVLSINSQPTGAAIYIDDRLQSATNTSISFLDTGSYKVRLTKEGYRPWEKMIGVNNQLVTKIDAILWPATPDPTPITTTGILNPILSPDKSKMIYAIKYSEEDKAGLWILDMNKKAVFNNTTTEFRQITRNTLTIDYSNATFIWSPDSTEVLATLTDASGTNRNYLLDITRFNNSPPDVTLSKTGLSNQWLKDYKMREQLLKEEIRGNQKVQDLIASSTIPVRWSYDGELMLYGVGGKGIVVEQSPTTSPSKTTARSSAAPASTAETTTLDMTLEQYISMQRSPLPEGVSVKVYNTQTEKTYDLPYAKFYEWYPVEEKAEREIQHLLMVEDTGISMIESDGQNKSTIYAASFDPASVHVWPDGGRLIISANFNPRAGSEPNLYTINLR